jgi:chemotaxis protein CheZ
MNQPTKKLFSAERHLLNTAGGIKLAANAPGGFNHSGQSFVSEGAEAIQRRELINTINELCRDLLQGAELGASLEHQARIQAFAEELNEARLIKNEIINLSRAIDTTKREIAAIRYKSANFERIADVSGELDEVVADTERATNTILSKCEQIEGLVTAIHRQGLAAVTAEEVEGMGETIFHIYEACNFQDITGQRINRVVGALKYIEERVDAMMHVWGGKEIFAAIPLPEAEVLSEDEALLNGPARANEERASQEDIDSLFD